MWQVIDAKRFIYSVAFFFLEGHVCHLERTSVGAGTMSKHGVSQQHKCMVSLPDAAHVHGVTVGCRNHMHGVSVGCRTGSFKNHHFELTLCVELFEGPHVALDAHEHPVSVRRVIHRILHTHHDERST